MAWKFFTALGQEKQDSFLPVSDVNFGGYKATLLGDPTSAQDAATKAYVDGGGGGQPALDAVPWRGYAFRMVSGEAAITTGYIRAGQSNNNSYDDPDYFQGWLAGLNTSVKVMKAGWVRIHAVLYCTSTVASTVEAGISVNSSQLTGTRISATAIGMQYGLAMQAVRYSAVNDVYQFGPVSNCSMYQGTDGRYSNGYLEYLGP